MSEPTKLPFDGPPDRIPEGYVSPTAGPEWHGGPTGDWFAIHQGVHWRIGRRFHVWRDGRPIFGGPFDGHHLTFTHAADFIAQRLPTFPVLSKFRRWLLRGRASV